MNPTLGFRSRTTPRACVLKLIIAMAYCSANSWVMVGNLRKTYKSDRSGLSVVHEYVHYMEMNNKNLIIRKRQ